MKVLPSICIIFEEDKLHLGIKNELVHFLLFSVYIIFVALMNTIIAVSYTHLTLPTIA